MPESRSPLKAGSGVSRFLTLVLPIVVACACVWMARPQAAAERGATVSNDRIADHFVPTDHSVSHSDAIPVSLPAASQKLITRPIEEITPGMRVLAENPENAGVDIQRLEIANVTDWRLIRYQMPKPDGSYLFVDMLRHTDELEGQSVGAFSPLSFPELAIEGDAEITAINVCPPIESGSGYLVTTKFTHTAANVIDLRVASEAEPIGTTSNHPFWSEDRQDWVQAGELQLGEQLQLIDGTLTQVVSIAENSETQPVYNLTVDAQHTYHVGASGVLVHNAANYLVRFGKGPETVESLATQAAAAQRTGRFPHGVSTILSKRPASAAHRGALLDDVAEHFPVHPTPTDRFPLHQTVELPNPVTQTVVDLFNSIFGG